MHSLTNGLSVPVRHCPNCDEKQTVHYWAHSDAHEVKRYQCQNCGNQTEDFDVMDIGPSAYVGIMTTKVLPNMSRDEYIMRFGSKVVRTEDGEFKPLFRLLE